MFGRFFRASASEGLDCDDVSGSTAPTDLSLSPSCRRRVFDMTWGGARGGGKLNLSRFDLTHYLSAIPPALSLPHQGGGDDEVAALRLPQGTPGPGSRAEIGAVRSRRHLGPRLPGMTSEQTQPRLTLNCHPGRAKREPGHRGPGAKELRGRVDGCNAAVAYAQCRATPADVILGLVPRTHGATSPQDDGGVLASRNGLTERDTLGRLDPRTKSGDDTEFVEALALSTAPPWGAWSCPSA
jgi:hypothetical protein